LIFERRASIATGEAVHACAGFAGVLLAAATSRPDKRYMKVPEATHLMLLEQHRDALHRATNEFLRGEQPYSPA
jgi:hypothetical protein